MNNSRKLKVIHDMCVKIQEATHDQKTSASREELQYCTDLMARTILVLLEEPNYKNNSGMLDYMKNNITATYMRVFNLDVDSSEIETILDL